MLLEEVKMSREKILQATWELIKAEGIESVTTRKIASHAQTNIASVNYYFGSKEQLINEVVKQRMEALREAFQVLDETAIAPMTRLKRFLHAYAALLLEHPELAKRLFSQEALFESQLEYKKFLKRQGFEQLIATILEIIGPQPREKALLMIRHIFGALFFPLVIRSSFNPAIDTSLMDPHMSLDEHIDLFLEYYFSSFQAKPREEGRTMERNDGV
jgi:AcrR family transcriptional regulator